MLDVDPTDVLRSCTPRVVAPREATARLRAHRLRFTLRCPSTALERCRGTVRVAVRLRRRLRGRDLTASFVTHRARPPASERTTLWAFRLR